MPTTPQPDPLTAGWPRKTARTTLRPVTEDDAEAMLAYRSDPVVTRHLPHDPLTMEQVRTRIRERTSGQDRTPGRLVRGFAVEVDGRLVGDCMLRVQPSPDDTEWQVWIGYVLHPDAWGQGLATEVAQALVEAGHEMGLPVWASVAWENAASARVLEKAGLRPVKGQTDPTAVIFGEVRAD